MRIRRNRRDLKKTSEKFKEVEHDYDWQLRDTIDA